MAYQRGFIWICLILRGSKSCRPKMQVSIIAVFVFTYLPFSPFLLRWTVVWIWDWVGVVSKCIMGLFWGHLSLLSLAITRLHRKLGPNLSHMVIGQDTDPVQNGEWSFQLHIVKNPGNSNSPLTRTSNFPRISSHFSVILLGYFELASLKFPANSN